MKDARSAEGPEVAGASSPVREPWGWTRSQRLGLGMLLFLLLVFLGIGYWRRPYRMNDGVVVENGQQVTLPIRMDPNEASVEELGRIPHVGESLARKIVDWREARKGTAAEGIVFRQLEDVDAVPGVGKKLLEEMKPFLKFPGEEN
jgi:DNA uptake protein ComE-like DNA-binding protein